jgi:hypothetical protein
VVAAQRAALVVFATPELSLGVKVVADQAAAGQPRAGLRAHRYIDLHFQEILGIMDIRDHLYKLVAN